jgi:copper resistance protein C
VRRPTLPFRALALMLAAPLPALLPATPASALPAIVSSSPAANATVAPTDRIELRFSEPLAPALLRASLVMTDMPGMAMPTPMAMKIRTTPSADRLGLVATLPSPLPRGAYALHYQAGSSEGDRVEGDLSFTVR